MEDNNIIEQKTKHLLDELKRTTDEGQEFWLAREIQKLLGYSEWRSFSEDAIGRAKSSCASFGGTISNHFVHMHKMVSLGSGSSRNVEDIILSRYACYLIAMNGDPRKPEIAGAQAYFAIQTRKQELFDQLTEAQKRLALRNRVKKANRFLGEAAKGAGVRNWPLFQDAGYRGLYGGLGVRQLKEKKGIPNNEDLLDCIGRMELAENEFRITQTEAKLIRKQIKGDVAARQTHNEVAKVIRKSIQEIGAPVPENLPREVSIKQLQKVTNSLKELPQASDLEGIK